MSSSSSNRKLKSSKKNLKQFKNKNRMSLLNKIKIKSKKKC